MIAWPGLKSRVRRKRFERTLTRSADGPQRDPQPGAARIVTTGRIGGMLWVGRDWRRAGQPTRLTTFAQDLDFAWHGTSGSPGPNQQGTVRTRLDTASLRL